MILIAVMSQLLEMNIFVLQEFFVEKVREIVTHTMSVKIFLLVVQIIAMDIILRLIAVIIQLLEMNIFAQLIIHVM